MVHEWLMDDGFSSGPNDRRTRDEIERVGLSQLNSRLDRYHCPLYLDVSAAVDDLIELGLLHFDDMGQLEDLLDDNAEYIHTRQGGKKKKYNTQKVWIYEVQWMRSNDPRLDDKETIVYFTGHDEVIARVKTRLAIKATRMQQTVPEAEVVSLEPVLYSTASKRIPRLSNYSGMERQYNRNRNWQ